MIIIVFIVGAVVFVGYCLINMPSKRARTIFDAQGTAPEEISDRDRAWVADLYSRFGTRDFRLSAIREQMLDANIANRFGVVRKRLDDIEEIGVRLPQLKLLVSFEPGRYRLTEEAARLGERLAKQLEECGE